MVKVEGTGTHLINPKAQPGFISERSVPGRHTGLPLSHIYWALSLYLHCAKCYEINFVFIILF